MTIIGDASKARLLALFIDHLVAFAVMMLAVAFVPESLSQMKALFFILIYLAYFVVLEGLWFRTLGKFVQGLVVRKVDGNRCDWTAALIRGFCVSLKLILSCSGACLAVWRSLQASESSALEICWQELS